MPTRVLATKLHVPAARGRIVARPRLLERLEPVRPLTLVSAPAGSGKTALLAGRVTDAGRRAPDTRVARLSRDDGDNDPSRFPTHLVSALRTADVGAEALTPLHDAPALPLDVVLTSVLNDAAAAAPGRTVLCVPGCLPPSHPGSHTKPSAARLRQDDRELGHRPLAGECAYLWPDSLRAERRSSDVVVHLAVPGPPPAVRQTRSKHL